VGWAADALALLTRCGEAVDWDRFVSHTREHEVGVPVLSAVVWLRAQFPGLVPDAAVDAVGRVPAPRWQRLEHAVKVRQRPLVGTLPVLPFDHHRLRRRRAGAPGLARYLQRTFREERLSRLPRASARLAVDRLRGWLRPPGGDGAVRPAWSALLDGTARMLVGECVVLASGVGTAAILSRLLGVAGYGLFGVVSAIVYWAELTLPMLYSRAVLSARTERDADFEAGVQWLYAGTGLALAAAIALAAPHAGRWLGDPAIGAGLLLFAVDVPIAALATGQRVLLVARGAYSRVAAIGIARAAGRFALIAAALAWRPDVSAALAASIAASVLELAVSTALIGGGWPRAPRLPRLDVRGAIVPLAAASFSLRLYRRLDLLLVQALARSDVATGLYGAAQNVSLVLTTINNTLAPALLSSLSRLEPGAEEARRQLAATALRVLLLPLPALAFCAGTAGEIAALVYGEPFRRAGPVMALLAVASYVEIVGAVASTPLIAAGRVSPLVAATAPLVPLAAIGHAWAVPRLGAGGAALVTLALAAGCTIAVIRSALRLRVIEGAGRGTAAATLVAGVALAASLAFPPAGWTVVPAALASGIAGAAVLVAAGVVPAADLAGLTRLTGRRR
jgi:O-antigen/teichoic acid export membrane protein